MTAGLPLPGGDEAHFSASGPAGRSGRWPRVATSERCVSAADLLQGPDDMTAWIRFDLLTRRVVGRRLEQGPTPETDEALDKLMVPRAWTARRLAN
jgi:hypothetical protein